MITDDQPTVDVIHLEFAKAFERFDFQFIPREYPYYAYLANFADRFLPS